MEARGEMVGRLMRRFGLTPREATVAVGLAEGKTYKEIAEDLDITFHTVNAHVKAILSKTEAGSSRKLAAVVFRDHDPKQDGSDW